MSLRLLTTHAALLEASGEDAFVRYDVPAGLEHPGWALGSAVAVPRRSHLRRLGLLVLGPPADVDQLVGELVDTSLLPREIGNVTVAVDALDAVGAHLTLGEGNDWEWMYAAAPPPVAPAEDRLVELTDEDEPEIRRLLARANPRTDARPFEYAGQVWVGARDASGELVACGVREPSLAGYPILAGITVGPAERGSGLGRAVTAYLTRDAVEEAGLCTLGMYSDNTVARSLYTSLGYGGIHRWASRRLARPAPGA